MSICLFYSLFQQIGCLDNGLAITPPSKYTAINTGIMNRWPVDRPNNNRWKDPNSNTPKCGSVTETRRNTTSSLFCKTTEEQTLTKREHCCQVMGSYNIMSSLKLKCVTDLYK